MPALQLYQTMPGGVRCPSLVMQVPEKYQGRFAAIVCGANHVLARLDDNSTVAWGANGDGQAKVPAAAAGPGATKAVSAGTTHSLFLLSNGNVVMAGKMAGVAPFPPEASGGKVVAVASGGHHGALLLKGGKLIMIGDNR
jgi:hypothetical protein